MIRSSSFSTVSLSGSVWQTASTRGGGGGGDGAFLTRSTWRLLTYSRRKARSVWEPTLHVVNVFITFKLIPERLLI